MYLLDTCAVSDYVKVYSASLNGKLMSFQPSQICVSSITLDEIEFGLTKNETARKKLGSRIQIFLETLPEENILSFDAVAARISGKLRAKLQETGKTMEQYDLFIAAVALAHHKILVTSNLKHFQNIPHLIAENWRK